MVFTKAELAAKRVAAEAYINARWAKQVNAILGPDADATMREAAIVRLVQAGVLTAFRAAPVAKELGLAVGQ
ncbi:MAG: hypothetical protein WC683_06730 [bacterium]